MPDAPVTVGSLLASGRARLQQAGGESAGLEAALLLAHLLGWERTRLLAHPEEPVDLTLLAAYTDLIRRRLDGEPVAYLTGQREFWGRAFLVDRRVLVPRPETEHIVEGALAHLARLPAGPRLAVDIGTGSGAIAVSLAADWPALQVVAVDRDAGALAVARQNIERFELTRQIRLVCGSLLDWLGCPVDLITANLPYLRLDQAHAGLAHEPAGALYAGEDGLHLYRQLLPQLPARLRPGGLCLAEIDPSQATALLLLAGSVTPDWSASITADLAGHARVLVLAAPSGQRQPAHESRPGVRPAHRPGQ